MTGADLLRHLRARIEFKNPLPGRARADFYREFGFHDHQVRVCVRYDPLLLFMYLLYSLVYSLPLLPRNALTLLHLPLICLSHWALISAPA